MTPWVVVPVIVSLAGVSAFTAELLAYGHRGDLIAAIVFAWIEIVILLVALFFSYFKIVGRQS